MKQRYFPEGNYIFKIISRIYVSSTYLTRFNHLLMCRKRKRRVSWNLYGVKMNHPPTKLGGKFRQFWRQLSENYQKLLNAKLLNLTMWLWVATFVVWWQLRNILMPVNFWFHTGRVKPIICEHFAASNSVLNFKPFKVKSLHHKSCLLTVGDLNAWWCQNWHSKWINGLNMLFCALFEMHMSPTCIRNITITNL